MLFGRQLLIDQGHDMFSQLVANHRAKGARKLTVEEALDRRLRGSACALTRSVFRPEGRRSWLVPPFGAGASVFFQKVLQLLKPVGHALKFSLNPLEFSGQRL